MENFLENYRKPKISPLSNLRLPARATIYYMLTSALAKVVGILTTPIFTRILSGEDFGKYTLYMSWLGLFTIICSGIISQAVIYRGFEKFKDKKQSFLFSAFVLGIGFTAVICSLLFAFSPFLGLETDFVLLLSIQLLCDETVGIFQTARRYEYNYRALSLTNAISVILTPILSVVLIFGTNIGYKGRIFALLIVSLCIAIPHLYALLRLGVGKFESAMAKYVLGRTLPLLPHTTSVAFGAEIDKLMITTLLGAEALAKYSVAHTLGLGLGFAVSALASSLYPWVVRKLSSGKGHEVEPTFGALITAIGGVVIAIALFVPEIFAFLAPKAYADAALATLPLLISTLPSFASSFVTVGIVNKEKGGYTFYSAAGSIITNVILNLFLIPKLKYIGAAISLLISVTAGLILNCIFLKRSGSAEIFSQKTFLKQLTISSLGTLAAPLTYENTAIRILLLTIPTAMLFKSYEILRTMIREEA